MDVNFLLDKCKEVCGVRTDGELAAALGVSKQALSSYRNGHRLPDPVQCATIAGLSGLPLAQVMGIVGEARAISREEKAVWRKLAATAALLAVVVFPALSERAQAATHDVSASQTRHYAKLDAARRTQSFRFCLYHATAPSSPSCPCSTRHTGTRSSCSVITPLLR